jgi:DNA-directed RNA polymerase subunit RPC12/RpoP
MTTLRPTPFVCDECRGCGRTFDMLVPVGQNFVQNQAEMRIRCPECDTTNACVRELPDQGRPTIRRTGPDWLIRTPGVSG